MLRLGKFCVKNVWFWVALVGVIAGKCIIHCLVNLWKQISGRGWFPDVCFTQCTVACDLWMYLKVLRDLMKKGRISLI